MDAAHRMGAPTRVSLFVTPVGVADGDIHRMDRVPQYPLYEYVVFDPFLLPIYIEALKREEWPGGERCTGSDQLKRIA